MVAGRPLLLGKGPEVLAPAAGLFGRATGLASICFKAAALPFAAGLRERAGGIFQTAEQRTQTVGQLWGKRLELKLRAVCTACMHNYKPGWAPAGTPNSEKTEQKARGWLKRFKQVLELTHLRASAAAGTMILRRNSRRDPA
jgi:hypothetical protein